ncbi:MAG: hypothetical protein BWY64_03779 [bacterium ADurb.Bin363]|nr:MAG: hypothetical protein BWY64_03779 [bacterium ADurb.Bin363]
MTFVEERVDKLEDLVAQTQLMIQSLSYEVSRTQISVNRLSNEMKDFKVYTQNTIDGLSKNIDKLGEKMNKKWEDVVKKQGTLVEDMVAPNIKFIVERYFNCKKADCQSFAIRYEKQHPKVKGTQREFDVIAVYPDKVIVNETKSNPKPELAVEFIDFIKSGEFFEYFPEYKSKELIPIFASFHIPENVLKKLSKNKIYAMGIKEDTMDILNPKF